MKKKKSTKIRFKNPQKKTPEKEKNKNKWE